MSFRNRPGTEKALFEEILARLDDLERATVNPVQRVGDNVYYVDPIHGDQILLAPECPCTTTGSPIWLPAGLSGSTWTSVGGDARTLLDDGAEAVTGPGYVMSPTAVIGEFGTKINHSSGSSTWDNTGGVIEYVMEASQWWTKPRGKSEHNQIRGGHRLVRLTVHNRDR